MANVLNSFLPGKAGDLVKAFYLREHGGMPGNLGSVLLERTVDVTVLGLLGLAAYGLTGHTWGLVTALVLLGGAGTVFLVLQFVPFARWLPVGRWGDAALAFRAVWRNWIQHPVLAAQTAVASLCVWLLCGSVLGSLAAALHQPLGWTETFAVFPLAIMAGLMPITVGGLGTREAVMTALLAPRLSREAATVLSLGYTAFTYWFLSAISLPAVGAEIWRWLRRDREAAGPAQRRAS